jgi:hypothetical protein
VPLCTQLNFLDFASVPVAYIAGRGTPHLSRAALTLKPSVMTVNEQATRLMSITSEKAFGRENRAIPQTAACASGLVVARCFAPYDSSNNTPAVCAVSLAVAASMPMMGREEGDGK